MNITVKEVVEHILAKISHGIGIDIPFSEENSDVEIICSLAEKASGGEFVACKKRGLSSIFDMLQSEDDNNSVGNILCYDYQKRIFTRHSKAEFSPALFDESSVQEDFNYISGPEHWFEVLKKYTADIPCTESGELSVYSYARLVSAFGGAVAGYCMENGLPDDFESKNAFALYTADFSGIQNFIYTIINEDALKTLRAKSFFVEIVMAQLTAEITDMFGLTSANVLYSGGGHCYMLLTNVKDCRDKLQALHANLNHWSMENFGNSLSVVWDIRECSVNDFLNKPDGKYKELFSGLSGQMAKRKFQKYSFKEIIDMNDFCTDTDRTRECKICGASSKKVKKNGDTCEWCDTFKRMSKVIADRKQSFAVLKNNTINSESEEKNKPVPFFSYSGEAYFYFGKPDMIEEQIQKENVIRIFCKNEYPSEYIEKYPSGSIIDVCDYIRDNMLENLAESSDGIKRLGVLRMDVDNLGSTFISGFAETDVNIGRTAALSAQLTGFFKNNLTYMLEKKGCNISVLYAGGDDVFLVGSWNDVIDSAVELIKEFKDFTGGKLSISGGIGIYNHKYPVARFAVETEELEACSKNHKYKDGDTEKCKDSVTLFYADDTKSQTYSWTEFDEKVIGEKLHVIKDFISADNDKGNSFLYKLLEYLRGILSGDKINIARAAYLLGRMCTEFGKENQEQKKIFSDKIFGWIDSGSKNDIKQLVTAIIIFVYERRNIK